MDKEFPSSRFDRKGIFPKVSENVHLIDGYIEDTLPNFVGSTDGLEIAFVHVDTDTYSPASVILKNLKPYLSSGSIILFDELCGYPNWRAHEYKALIENFSEDEYEFIGFSVGARSINLMNAAVRIL
ncbi:MAG: hypothetical protein AseanaTS_21780 [Candidatus Pelagadaptatus aseana]